MKRHINNPHKVNWKIYGLIGGISLLITIITVILCRVENNSILNAIQNLAIGCVASTLVALLIEVGNIKEKNIKANSAYDLVYSDLQLSIWWYLETWARLCCIAYKDKDYYQEKHTWMEWYEITKSKFTECDDKRQTELIHFFAGQLMTCIDDIIKAFKKIDSQQYYLNLNDIYDENLKRILADYNFEFSVAKLTLESDYNKENFWRAFDAIKQDLINYIDSWVDIKYYNYYRLKPYQSELEKTELKHAIMESVKSNTQ